LKTDHNGCFEAKPTQSRRAANHPTVAVPAGPKSLISPKPERRDLATWPARRLSTRPGCSSLAPRTAELAASGHSPAYIFCLDGSNITSLPVRATEGIGMSVVCDDPRGEWPDPLVVSAATEQW